MSKEFRNMLLISIGLVLLFAVSLGGGHWEDLLLGVAIIVLIAAILNLLIGLILIISSLSGSSGYKYGPGFLLTSGILLLGSWTLCSSGWVHFI